MIGIEPITSYQDVFHIKLHPSSQNWRPQPHYKATVCRQVSCISSLSSGWLGLLSRLRGSILRTSTRTTSPCLHWAHPFTGLTREIHNPSLTRRTLVGARDGNRTRLILIDSQLLSQRTTRAMIGTSCRNRTDFSDLVRIRSVQQPRCSRGGIRTPVDRVMSPGWNQLQSTLR